MDTVRSPKLTEICIDEYGPYCMGDMDDSAHFKCLQAAAKQNFKLYLV